MFTLPEELIGWKPELREWYWNNRFVCLTSALILGLRFVNDGFKVQTCGYLIGRKPETPEWNWNNKLVGCLSSGDLCGIKVRGAMWGNIASSFKVHCRVSKFIYARGFRSWIHNCGCYEFVFYLPGLGRFLESVRLSAMCDFPSWGLSVMCELCVMCDCASCVIIWHV